MESEFKVGDKVKYIGEDVYKTVKYGEIYVVAYDSHWLGSTSIYNMYNDAISFPTQDLELVAPKLNWFELNKEFS